MRHVLVGLRQTAATGVVEPAVIIAAQPALLNIAIAEVGATVPAMAVEEAVFTAEIFVEDEILAHEPHRQRSRVLELAGAGDRPPIAAQQIAHRGAGAGFGQNIPAAARSVGLAHLTRPDTAAADPSTIALDKRPETRLALPSAALLYEPAEGLPQIAKTLIPLPSFITYSCSGVSRGFDKYAYRIATPPASGSSGHSIPVSFGRAAHIHPTTSCVTLPAREKITVRAGGIDPRYARSLYLTA